MNQEGKFKTIPTSGPSAALRQQQQAKGSQTLASGEHNQIGPTQPIQRPPLDNLTPPTKQIDPEFEPGDLVEFKMGIAKRDKSGVWQFDRRYPIASIELAPARRSFAEHQGQKVPGSGAGLEHQIKTNLVKLNVPASRPIYQQMGIASEKLEWVGAFVGFDNGDTIETMDPHNLPFYNKRVHNAWVEAMNVKDLFRVGREIMIKLRWSNNFAVEFDSDVYYRGLIEEMDFSFATEQRVYYYVCLWVTNREDMNTGEIHEIAPPQQPTGGYILDAKVAAEAAQSAVSLPGADVLNSNVVPVIDPKGSPVDSHYEYIKVPSL